MKQLTEKEIKILIGAPEGAEYFIEGGIEEDDGYWKKGFLGFIASAYSDSEGQWVSSDKTTEYFEDNAWRAISVSDLREKDQLIKQQELKIDNAVEALIHSGFDPIVASDCVETLAEKGVL